MTLGKSTTCDSMAGMASVSVLRDAMDATTSGGHGGQAPDTVLLTTAAVGVRLGVKARTAERMVRRGDLPAVRLGRHYRVSAGVLAKFIDRLPAVDQPGSMTP